MLCYIFRTEIVLFDGTMLILQMIQFAMVASKGNKELSAEMHQLLILRLLRTLMSTLMRPNSTSNSRRVAYRTFVEVRQAVIGAGYKEIEVGLFTKTGLFLLLKLSELKGKFVNLIVK